MPCRWFERHLALTFEPSRHKARGPTSVGGRDAIQGSIRSRTVSWLRRLSDTRTSSRSILALPRGGVPVAAEVAAALKAPLDLILVRKIGVPFQPELAMGAVVDGGAPHHRAQ